MKEIVGAKIDHLIFNDRDQIIEIELDNGVTLVPNYDYASDDNSIEDKEVL